MRHPNLADILAKFKSGGILIKWPIKLFSFLIGATLKGQNLLPSGTKCFL